MFEDSDNINRIVTFAEAVNRDGFALVPSVLTPREARDIGDALDAFIAETQSAGDGETTATSRRGGKTGGDAAAFGVRNLLSDCNTVRAVARRETVRRLPQAVLGADCFAVRAIWFDKTPGANWRVPWHQDLSIAVAARLDDGNSDVAGWGPWSDKAGAIHVQPPAPVLSQMLTVRLHLDPCGLDNGPLRVLPRTHEMGRLCAEAIADLRTRRDADETVCASDLGGAVVMRPLVLHASSPAEKPARRRVLHIEYASARALDAAGPAPPGLRWRDAV